MSPPASSELQPAFKSDWGVALDPLADQLVGDNLKRSIPVAFGAVVLVLLLASANIANLSWPKASRAGKKWASAPRSERAEAA